MGRVELRDIHAGRLKGVNLDIVDGEIFALVGPPNSGKTTLLKVIAGLTDYSGSVSIDGQQIDDLPLDKRGIGYLSQEENLPSDLDVLSSIEYGLKTPELPRDKIIDRILSLMHRLGVEDIVEKRIRDLSVFQRRKIGIARALAPSPKALILDDPFKDLKSFEKDNLMECLKKIRDDMKLTIILATRSFMEIENLADRVAVIIDGVVNQVGTPSEILFTPKNEAVLKYTCLGNKLNCLNFSIIASGLALVNCGFLLVAPYSTGVVRKIVIYPEGVKIFREKPKNLTYNLIKAKIVDIEELRRDVNVKLSVIGAPGIQISAKIEKEFFETLSVECGSDVFAWIDPTYIRVSS